MTRSAICGTVVLGLLFCGAATAAETKIYKHVDENGNVVYSQTPPVSGAKSEKLDLQPAYRGRGGYDKSASPYDNPRTYSHDGRRDQYKKTMEQQQQKITEARKNRVAELEAECIRNRGTDCSNPEVLRYNESTKIPRRAIILLR